MALTFKPEDFEAMKVCEGALVRCLMPFRERIEAGLVVFALIRCARTMLRLYPEATQKKLLLAVIPFLEGKTRPDVPLESESGLLLLQ